MYQSSSPHRLAAHASLLAAIAADAEQAAAANPCDCPDGLCDHCSRLAWLVVSAKEAHAEFVARTPLVRRVVAVAA